MIDFPDFQKGQIVGAHMIGALIIQVAETFVLFESYNIEDDDAI